MCMQYSFILSTYIYRVFLMCQVLFWAVRIQKRTQIPALERFMF